MERSRHNAAPHYVRFARALALASAMGGCTATGTAADDGGTTSDATNDCYVVTPPGVVHSAGDAACYQLDGGALVPCPPTCDPSPVDAGAIGPLAPPDLPRYS